MNQITLTAIPNIPLVQVGDDIGQLILTALEQAGITLQDGDILAIAQKIVSKAEGRFVSLSSVTVSEEAKTVAQITDKDPRLVELILGESQGISRMKKGVLITRHKLGFTSANAGIDQSNVGGGEDTVLLLPLDPDGTAEQLRQQIVDQAKVAVGIIVTDSHGRPFRLGTVGVAIGVAGLPAVWDRRGEQDLFQYELQHTDIGIADELAAAASLLMGAAAERMPVVLIRGITLPAIAGKASHLTRAMKDDLYYDG